MHGVLLMWLISEAARVSATRMENSQACPANAGRRRMLDYRSLAQRFTSAQIISFMCLIRPLLCLLLRLLTGRTLHLHVHLQLVLLHRIRPYISLILIWQTPKLSFPRSLPSSSFIIRALPAKNYSISSPLSNDVMGIKGETTFYYS